MENRHDTGDWGGNQEQWQDTVQLLRLVQRDYQQARQQLEKVSQVFGERETQVGERLQYALQTPGQWQILCLIPAGIGASVSQIGKVVLGKANQPFVLPAVMRLEVRCLGRFEVRSNWKQLDRWDSLKAKSIFKYLATQHRQPVLKDVLMETFWPDCTPQAANNNLKSAMHALRQTFASLFSERSGSHRIGRASRATGGTR